MSISAGGHHLHSTPTRFDGIEVVFHPRFSELTPMLNFIQSFKLIEEYAL